MLAFRSVQQGNHRVGEDFLYELKAGPAGGRLRRPSSAGNTSTGSRASLPPATEPPPLQP
jgi:hypothetical protein